MFLEDDCGPISPFHDIPLVANDKPKTFHVVIEVSLLWILILYIKTILLSNLRYKRLEIYLCCIGFLI